jgi:hypothetical protein
MSLRDWFIAPPPPEEPETKWAPPVNARDPAEARPWSPPRETSEDAGTPRERGRSLLLAVLTLLFGRRPPKPTQPERPAATAAVLGRVGEVEPVAAAIALALRSPAATVIVVGPPPASVEPAGGGTRAARRLAARLTAQGFEATARGKLAWTSVPPDATVLAAGATVLAIAAPLTPALEHAIAAQDLAVLVTADPDGALASIALASLAPLAIPVLTTPPLRRGIARRLAIAGIRAPREAAQLAATARRTAP